MSLYIRHEDGFIAYLNGVELARDNVSGIPHWDAVADSNRPNTWSHNAIEYDVSSFTPLLRVDAIDANHVSAIKAAVHLLATETAKQISTQYPGVNKSDIYAVFGITSRPVDRTINYYTGAKIKRMTWDGGLTSAPGMGLEKQHENDLIIVASNYPVCGIQSGADSGTSAERCARSVLSSMQFVLHRCVLDESQDGRGASFSRPLRLPPVATALGTEVQTYEVQSQAQLTTFLRELGVARSRTPAALDRGSDAQYQFNHAQKVAFCQFAYGGPCTGFLYVHYALQRRVVEAQLSTE